MGDGLVDGRVALVTGAGRGIGRHIARWLADGGARLVVCARTRPGIDALAEELHGAGTDVVAEACDVSRPDDVTALVDRARQRFGGVDIAVTNAGILGPVGRIDATDPEAWGHTLAVNVGGTAAVVRAVLPSMRARGWGRIITLSGAGVGGPSLPERASAYVASKAAVMVLTEVLAKELPDGVTINAIAPGAIPTGFMDEVVEAGPEVAGAALFEAVRRGTAPDLDPLRDLLLYLTSDEAAWCSGRCLSARRDRPAALRALAAIGIDEARFRLRRIDEDLYGVREGGGP